MQTQVPRLTTLARDDKFSRVQIGFFAADHVRFAMVIVRFAEVTQQNAPHQMQAQEQERKQ